MINLGLGKMGWVGGLIASCGFRFLPLRGQGFWVGVGGNNVLMLRCGSSLASLPQWGNHSEKTCFSVRM